MKMFRNNLPICLKKNKDKIILISLKSRKNNEFKTRTSPDFPFHKPKTLKRFNCHPKLSSGSCRHI